MGTIVFEGERPFELVTQQLPTTTAEGQTVVVTLPVFVAGFPQQTLDIQVRMSIEHAEQVAAQIQPILVTARVNRKAGR
ncbi:MAG TPA: hypothetical protein VK804_27550 [Bradyrhizobium sp.]|uniref:hypothetical protein n=1 Tax=Bradyrhizobium sp. TaxID=376 RepID=UPI002B7636A5|nr:hypothetical protein [Bradyrhizobium sp.]HTB04240.1 hypothetical protein [Bradyrhizobium sp.]